MFERLHPIDHEARGDLAITVDIKPHVDAAELGRIESNLEAAVSRLRPCGDFDRESGNRHGRFESFSCGVGQGGCSRAQGALIGLEDCPHRFRWWLGAMGRLAHLGAQRLM
jgi:hypothetical protein